MIVDPSKPARSRKTMALWILFLSMLVIYAWAYSYLGAVLILGKNIDRTGSTQAAFIDAVYRSASVGANEERPSILGEFTSLLPQYTDGTVDPLFPWLLRKHASQPPDVVFESGKWMNFILSGSLLLGFALAAARAFSFSGAMAAVLMGGFGVILERSAYFSPDAIYYLLIVLTWLCALSLIRQNHLWLYGVFGILLGLSYLAKPLVWPIVLGFVLVSIIRSLWIAFRTRKDRQDAGVWSPSNQLVGFAMTIAAFLLITGPRLSYAAANFGDPLHSYQKYFIWLDTPSEAALFQQQHPGKTELEAIPPGEKPGLVRFVTQKGFSALIERGTEGALAQVKSSVLGRGGWILVYGVFVFVVIAGIHRWAALHQNDEIWQVRGTSARWMLLFLCLVIAITLFYSGIGNPIIPHSAMTTSLFLPILVTFIWISERYRRQLQRSQFARLVNGVYVVLMAGSILWITCRIVLGLHALMASPTGA
jgi:hypothetical protein